MHVFPAVQVVLDSVLSQMKKQCRLAGFPHSYCEDVSRMVLDQLRPLLSTWASSLPAFLQLRVLRSALRHVHDAGFVFLQIDRNPQRRIAVCRTA